MKKLKKINRSLLLGLLIVFSPIISDCQAINTQGYIITVQSDTIYGWIQLSRFDQITGGLVLNGIEEESFHSRVVFIAKGENRFKTYFPEMLLGFGFIYNSTDYTYQQITVQRKSIFKSEKQQYRFMRLVYEGDIGNRYKDVQIIPNQGLKMKEDEYVKFNTSFFRIKRNTKQTEQKETLKVYN